MHDTPPTKLSNDYNYYYLFVYLFIIIVIIIIIIIIIIIRQILDTGEIFKFNIWVSKRMMIDM